MIQDLKADFTLPQAVFGEVEAIPEDAARTLFNVQFWGPVYISKLV